LLTYTLTNLGAFTLVTAVEKDDGTGTEISDFAGLGRTRPIMALAMTLFMFSLICVPPTAGMVGKFFVFQAAVEAGQDNLLLLIVTIIGVLTSVVSAFYYLRVVVFMFMRDGEGRPAMQPALGIALAVTALGTLILGVVPAPIFELAQRALIALSG
jgi:NADH-quinone oxidoreductase subunit N